MNNQNCSSAERLKELIDIKRDILERMTRRAQELLEVPSSAFADYLDTYLDAQQTDIENIKSLDSEYASLYGNLSQKESIPLSSEMNKVSSMHKDLFSNLYELHKKILEQANLSLLNIKSELRKIGDQKKYLSGYRRFVQPVPGILINYKMK